MRAACGRKLGEFIKREMENCKKEDPVRALRFGPAAAADLSDERSYDYKISLHNVILNFYVANI